MTRIAVPLLFTLCIAVASGDARGQEKVWQPSPGHKQIPIWPKEPPDAQPVPGPERMQPPDEVRNAYSDVAGGGL